MLLNTMLKIGGMLKIGFGESGAHIIANHLGALGELDPLQPGKMVECVYGHCEFTCVPRATNILQGNVVVLINRISAIVHGVTVKHGGAVLQCANLGCLLVWKLHKKSSIGKLWCKFVTD